jgi:hypothetical protein
MSATRALFAIGWLFICCGAFGAQEKTISVAEARSLVDVVLRQEQFPSNSKYCEVSSMDKGEPFVRDYYSFSASCDFPNTAATSAWGVYVVSPRTGEVVNFDGCRWFMFPELKSIQKQIMLRNHTTEAAEAPYRKNTRCH